MTATRTPEELAGETAARIVRECIDPTFHSDHPDIAFNSRTTRDTYREIRKAILALTTPPPAGEATALIAQVRATLEPFQDQSYYLTVRDFSAVTRALEALSRLAALHAEPARAGEGFTPTHRHYKGGFYRELLRCSLEGNLEPLVVYRNERGDTWARPEAEFDGAVALAGGNHRRFRPLHSRFEYMAAASPPPEPKGGEPTLADEICEFGKLQSGWDGENADAPLPAAIADAVRFVEMVGQLSATLHVNGHVLLEVGDGGRGSFQFGGDGHWWFSLDGLGRGGSVVHEPKGGEGEPPERTGRTPDNPDLPLGPFITENGAAGFTEIVTVDVPLVVEHRDGPYAVLRNLDTRAVVGVQFPTTPRQAPPSDGAERWREEAAQARLTGLHSAGPGRIEYNMEEIEAATVSALASAHAAGLREGERAERERAAGTQAAADVLAERRRQVEGEGWTAEHDDNHSRGVMASAAGVYALNAGRPHDRMTSHINYWPWSLAWWKPSTPRRDLVKAGALILAEIERLDRAAIRGAQP